MNRGHARRLVTLPAELVWATTWIHEANQTLGRHLGWPALEVLDCEEPSATDRYYGLHQKTRTIIRRASGQAFAWLDDEATDADQEWIDEHHAGAALLLRTDPHIGLTDADIDQLTAWVRSRP